MITKEDYLEVKDDFRTLIAECENYLPTLELENLKLFYEIYENMIETFYNITQQTTPQEVEEVRTNLEELYNKLFELDENESYKHFDSIGESYQYHNKYVSIKSALASSVSEIDTNKLNFYKQQLYEVNKKAFEDAFNPHKPNLEQLKNEIIEELNTYGELVWEDDGNFMEMSTKKMYFIYNLGDLWLQNIPIKLAHKITTYFTLLEEETK